jgi:hypothetical protein
MYEEKKNRNFENVKEIVSQDNILLLSVTSNITTGL